MNQYLSPRSWLLRFNCRSHTCNAFSTMATFRRSCSPSGFLPSLAIWQTGRHSVTQAARKKDLLRHPSSTRSNARASLSGTLELSAEHSVQVKTGLRTYVFQQFMQGAGNRISDMIVPLLPPHAVKSPMLLEVQLQDGILLMVGAVGTLTSDRPGNGGVRIWSYDSRQAAAAEAVALAQGMEVKHLAYNTGCSGAKVVVDLGPGRSPADIDRPALLDAIHRVLVALRGALYTGCDLNSTLDDMQRLAARSPYILAAIGNPHVDPNAATAHGVVGALIAALRPDLAGAGARRRDAVCAFNRAGADPAAARSVAGLLHGRRLLVHGCGSVGAVVAREAAALGATVYTLDAQPARADVPGCTNLSASPAGRAWWRLELDALVPCSKSGLLTAAMAAELRCAHIVGSANLPFADAAAQRAAECGGPGRAPARFVPEGVTSAGAVIVDSVEQHDPAAFAVARPDEMYALCRQLVFERTAELYAAGAAAAGAPLSEQLPALLERAAQPGSPPLGTRYRAWRALRLDTPATAVAAQRLAMLTSAVGGLAAAGARPAGRLEAAAAAAAATVRAFSTAAAAAAPGAADFAAAFAGGAPRVAFGGGGDGGGGRGADVVVCGGGIMGLNVAYHLKARDPGLRVVVLERAAGLGAGSSGWSTGFLRALYSLDATMRLALDGIAAYKAWGAYTRLAAPRARFAETGALWMLGRPPAENEAMRARLAAHGVRSDVLDAAALRERFPAISPAPYPELDPATGEPTGRDYGPLTALYEEGCG